MFKLYVESYNGVASMVFPYVVRVNRMVVSAILLGCVIAGFGAVSSPTRVCDKFVSLSSGKGNP